MTDRKLNVRLPLEGSCDENESEWVDIFDHREHSFTDAVDSHPQIAIGGRGGATDLKLDQDAQDAALQTHIADPDAHGGNDANNWLIANGGNDFTTAPTATGSNAITIGDGSTAHGANGISIGKDTSGSTASIAIGDTVQSAAGAVAIGQNVTTPSGASAVAIGSGASVQGATNAIAIGVGALITNLGYGIAIGSGANARSDTLIAIGQDAPWEVGTSLILRTTAGSLRVLTDGSLETSANGGTNWSAVGGGGSSNNWIYANNGADFTTNPVATGVNTIAIGNNSDAIGDYTIAIGDTAITNVGSDGISIGRSTSSGPKGISIGFGANTLGAGAGAGIAIGYSAVVLTATGIAIGSDVGVSSTATYPIVMQTDKCGLRIGTDGVLETSPDDGTTWSPVSGGGASDVNVYEANVLPTTVDYEAMILTESPRFHYRLNDIASPLSDSTGTTDGTEGASLIYGNEPLVLNGGGSIGTHAGWVVGGAPTGAITEWTYECWFKPDSVSGNQVIIGNDRSGWNGDVLIGIKPESGLGTAEALGFSHQSTSSHATYVESIKKLVVGETYHIVASSDGSSIFLYLNGEKVGESPKGGSDLAISTTEMYIGARNDSTRRYAQGLISEATFYEYTLTDQQVTDHYNAGAKYEPIEASINATDFTGHPHASGTALEIKVNDVVFFTRDLERYVWVGPDGVTVGVGGNHTAVESDVLVISGEISGGADNNWLIANTGVDFTTAPTASGTDSIAIGENAIADCTNSIAIGTDTNINTTNVGANNIAIGHDATITDLGGTRSIAIGSNVDATGEAVIVIGSDATSSYWGVAIGHAAVADDEAVAIGDEAVTVTSQQIAIGNNANCTSVDTDICIGTHAAGEDGTSIMMRSKVAALKVLSDGTIQASSDGGSNWINSFPLRKKIISGTAYELVAEDKDKMLVCTNASAVTITVPDGVFDLTYSVMTEIHIIQVGAGQVSVVGGGSQTVNSAETLNMRKQFSLVSLMLYDTDTWVMHGDLEAA